MHNFISVQGIDKNLRV